MIKKFCSVINIERMIHNSFKRKGATLEKRHHNYLRRYYQYFINAFRTITYSSVKIMAVADERGAKTLMLFLKNTNEMFNITNKFRNFMNRVVFI